MDFSERATLIGREVVYTPEFEESLRSIDGDPVRADEFVRGVEYEICRRPELGDRVAEGLEVYGRAITDRPGYPPVVLYYAFNQTHIFLLNIIKFDREADVEYL